MPEQEHEPVRLPEPWKESLFFDEKKWAKVIMFEEDRDEVKSLGTKQAFQAFEKMINTAANHLHCLENLDTGARIILQLSRVPCNGVRSLPSMSIEYSIKNMVILSGWDGEIRGGDLRDIPIRAILAAYAQHDAEKNISFNRAFLLDFPERKGIPKKYWVEDSDSEGDTVYSPANILDPLPAKYSKRPWFYALVAEQYDALAREHPDANVANLMVELNSDVAPGSVRRWITRARKEGLLPPADWKRGQ